MPTSDPETRHAGLEPGDDLADMADSIQHLAAQATELIVDEARRNPYRTVLVAAGVGYVLGGGIPSWALRLGFNAAVRTALAAAAAKVAVD